MKPYNILQKLDIMVKVLPKPNKKKRPTKNLIPFSFYSSRTLTYRKLPEQQSLKLSVLKLDGSSFSVHVARNASVAALKFAVQEEFCLSPRDERARLWALVWSHFCLCYQGQKLIRDVDCIQKYGIKDGDQLCFVQHLRVDLAPALEQSNDPSIKSKQASKAKVFWRVGPSPATEILINRLSQGVVVMFQVLRVERKNDHLYEFSDLLHKVDDE